MSLPHPHQQAAIAGQPAQPFASLLAGLADVPRDANAGIRLLECLLMEAWKADITDVHLTPTADVLHIAVRRDGHLHRVGTLEAAAGRLMLGRARVLARLPAADEALPQDGRFAVANATGQPGIEVRAAFFPVIHGQRVVMRLPERRVELRLDAMGLPAPLARSLERLALEVRDGLFLLTGPAGSGKTTAIYAMLHTMAQSPRQPNIMTLEDPVERELPGLLQTGIRPERGFDYPEAIRSVLRQDPDVIMIGEIRDPLSARMAGRAALTGHYVLSTVHAGAALAVPMRLDELGLEPHVRRAVLRGAMAQRLVRRRCPACSSQGAPSAACAACHGTGFAGRVPVAELYLAESHRHLLPTGSEAVDAEAHGGGGRWPMGGIDEAARKLIASQIIYSFEWSMSSREENMTSKDATPNKSS